MCFSRIKLNDIYSGKILKKLNDSKKLTEFDRESLFIDIYKNAEKVVHQFLSNNFIDKFGIAEAIFVGIKKLILKSNLKSPILLIDGNYNFKKKQAENNFYFNYHSIIKGDEKIASISAASIIAKVKRDRYMNKLSEKFPEYLFSEHKGYGTKKHIELISKYGYSKLHRLSFKLKKNEDKPSF